MIKLSEWREIHNTMKHNPFGIAKVLEKFVKENNSKWYKVDVKEEESLFSAYTKVSFFRIPHRNVNGNLPDLLGVMLGKDGYYECEEVSEMSLDQWSGILKVPVESLREGE